MYIPGGKLCYSYKTKHFIIDIKLDFSFKKLFWWHFMIYVIIVAL